MKKEDIEVVYDTDEKNLLFAILNKLEEIRCGIIDIEIIVDNETKYLNKAA